MSVAFLNRNTITYTASGSASIAFTVNTGGSNVVAFCILAFGTTVGAAITGVTYGGQAMTSCGAPEAGTAVNLNVQAFYLVNPPTGSNTLAVTGNTFVGEIYANLVAFQGVNQSTPVRPSTYQGTNQATGTTITLTITSSTLDLTLSVVSAFNGTTSTNQTSDGMTNAGATSCGSDHATTAASSITDTWTVANGPSVMVGFSIMAATGGGATATNYNQLMMTGCGT
jgi:hypothetical protein